MTVKKVDPQPVLVVGGLKSNDPMVYTPPIPDADDYLIGSVMLGRNGHFYCCEGIGLDHWWKRISRRAAFKRWYKSDSWAK